MKRIVLATLVALTLLPAIAAADDAVAAAPFALVRVVTGDDGKTRFVDARVPMELGDFAPPAPPNEISAHFPATQVTFGRLPPDWYGDWHPTPRRQYIVLMRGALEVETGDGAKREFSAPATMLLEDVSGRGHRPRVIGGTGAEYAAIAVPE